MANYPSGRSNHRSRRLTRQFLTLLLIPAVAITCLLFASTGSALPRNFRSWREFGSLPYSGMNFFNPKSTDYFACISNCGRFYATGIVLPESRALCEDDLDLGLENQQTPLRDYQSDTSR